MFKPIISAAILTLCLSGMSLAADSPTAQDRVIGGAFKSLAKAYVATANIEQLKAKNIQRIESMKPEWFRQKYAEVYAVAREFPLKIRTKYGIDEGMTKAEAIRVVRTFDKRKLYEIIDSIPDPVIADKFLESLKGDEEADSAGSLMDRVGRAWERIVQKLNRPPPKKMH